MSNNAFTVYIIDDDQAVRDALGLLLGIKGYAVALFADADSFLAAYQPHWTGCMLIDIRMPGMDGLTLQKTLQQQACNMPAIIMSAHGDVSAAREAFRQHAVDFLEKPIDHHKLINAIAEAYQLQHNAQQQTQQTLEFSQKLQQLTPRELEIMQLVVNGQHNRDIAQYLDISPRTVEVHKARIMMKLQVASVAELVRMYLLWQQQQVQG